MTFQTTPDSGTAPASPTPPDPGSTGPEQGADPGSEQTTVHPSWERTFDEAGIPDMLRPKLIEQVKRTEAEYNKGIEKIRAEVPDEWRTLIQQAQENGATPDEFVMSWNAAQEIRRDPIGFLDNFSAQVDQLVAAGQLTRAQGQQAKKDAAEQVDDAVLLENPEIAELKQQVSQLTAAQQAELERRQQEQEAQAQAQAQAEAEEYATNFVAAVDKVLPDLGYTGDPNTDQVAATARVTIGQLAAQIIDANDGLTPEQAVQQAVQQLTTVMGRQAAPAAQTPPAIGGGGANLPVPQAQKFASEAERDAAMIAAAQAFIQQQ